MTSHVVLLAGHQSGSLMTCTGHVSNASTALQGLRRGVYGGFAPCMLNTVTTVGLGFFGYDFGVEYYRRYIMDKPRNPTPGKRRLLNAPAEAEDSSSCTDGHPLLACRWHAPPGATDMLNHTPVPLPRAGERGFIAGFAAIGVMTATMPLEVVTRRMQVWSPPCVWLHRSVA
jgi:hypothetical protein